MMGKVRSNEPVMQRLAAAGAGALTSAHMIAPSARALLRALTLWMALISPTLADDALWNGKWDTSWPDGSARIELRQHGADVEGSYRLYDGRIVGKATGDRLEGEWIEGDRRGHFVFVLGPLRQAFTGRFDAGEWRTGVRAGTSEARPEIRDATPRETLRSFTLAGNGAVAGYPDVMADAVRLVDFGPAGASLDARQKLARTRALYNAVNLTTFRVWSLAEPAADAQSIDYMLPQSGTDARLRVTLVRQQDGNWRIAAPDENELANSYRALLKRYGGRAPAADAMQALRTPRDTMRAFVDAIQDWDSDGRQRVLETMDLSQLRLGYRNDHGLLQAQYMVQVINRVGAWQWQEIPDDPTSREPYVFFAHAAGRIVIAPQGEGDQTRWRFTADTVDSQLRLFVVTEDMPAIWGMSIATPGNGLFAMRHRIAEISPWLLARNVIFTFENWQIIAFFSMILIAVIAVVLLVPLVIRLFGLVLRLLGQPLDPDRGRRMVWPLRLIAVALIWYDFSRWIGLTGPGLTVLDSGMGVVAAIGIAWAGLPLVDALASGFYGRASKTAGNLDDIMVSLTAGLLKLMLIVGVAIVAAQAFDLPIGGMLAGLGIGGLAIAFASKEALSNLFGAGILLADRPFRNGDTIAVGDVQGTVEHVGIRSTRIRTMDDTVVVMPNGKLSDALINNYGARRYRLFRTRFSVGYATTPDQLESFTRKLRGIVDSHPSIAEEKTQVGLWQLGDAGIELDLVCYIRADTAADERAARHELLLHVMCLADETGVRFNNAQPAPA
jgi:MscS family membrane protein